MNKLTFDFDSTQEYVENEVQIAEPYSFLSGFFAHELGRRVDSVKHWMKYVRDALDGQDVETGYGNGWMFEGNGKTIKFTTVNKSEYAIPTPLLMEAFERYLMYLEARGSKSTKPTATG